MAEDRKETERKKELAAQYSAKLRAREARLKESLCKEQWDFFQRRGYSVDRSIYSALDAAMKDGKTVPQEYIEKNLGWLFGLPIPASEKDAVLYFAGRLSEYPYSDSYNRRSFRSQSNAAYTEKLMHIIGSYRSCTVDEPLENILNRELPEDAQAYLDEYSWVGCGYNCWQVAYALDSGNRAVEEAVRRILTEENGTGMMTAELVRGVLISHRSDFHELLGRLLLAAKLQEGLRQVICESADYGTKEGFLEILRVIDENNLVRFSSVKRAVGTWLGIMTEESRDLERVSEKSVRLIVDCLEDISVREEYLASEDAMKIHVALWSYGFDDIAKAVEKIARIAESGSAHRLLAAGYFASKMDLPYVANKIAKDVLKRHCDKDDVLAVWIPSFMPGKTSVLWDAVRYERPFEHSTWFCGKEEIEEYYILAKKLYGGFKGKTKTFSPCVFPWHEASISKSSFAEILCTLAVLTGDNGKMDEACAFIKDCESGQRQFYISALLRNPATAIQRKTALECLTDKDQSARRTAYGIAERLTLSADECRYIEGYLRFKSADIRRYVLSLLMKQDEAELAACISRLLDDKKEEVRFGALDMISQLGKDEKRSRLARSFDATLAERAKAASLSSKEKTLLESLIPKNSADSAEEAVLFTAEDKYLPTEFDEEYTELCIKTFEKYFPDSALPMQIKGERARLTEETAVCETAVSAAKDIESLAKLLDEHKHDSCVNGWGNEVLLGNILPHNIQDKDGNFMFAELWDKWRRENDITAVRLVRALALYKAYRQKTGFSEPCEEYVRTVFGAGFERGEYLPYPYVITMILMHLLEDAPKEELTHLGVAFTVWFMRCVPDDMVMVSVKASETVYMGLERVHLLAHDQLNLLYGFLKCKNNAELKHTFPLAVASAERCMEALKKVPAKKAPQGFPEYYIRKTAGRLLVGEKINSSCHGLVEVVEYLYAAHRGIITEAQLFEFLLNPDNIRRTLQIVTSVSAHYCENGRQVSDHDEYRSARNANTVRILLGKEGEPSEEDMALIRFVRHVYDVIVPAVLASELKRGDSPAKYTHGIYGIERIYGAEYLAEILSSMGGDTLDRTVYGGWSEGMSRRASLSYLLSVCIPADGDSAETLRAALEGKKITEKRLIEAALFSPEWIPMIGEYLGLATFTSVCYYFMAHMNEKFDGKRKAMIARYTPLSEDELNLGAFDVNWFRAAYSSIGEKTFELIYDAAKYISDGAKHSRARKYADATLGKFGVDETEKEVSDKRNKDLLMAYALIPLNGEDDICRRYLYVQRFRKESKQFGSQRIASEAKAVEMALTNLAINAGYSDTMRLTLRMETKVIDDSRALLEEQNVDGVSLKIVLDENGKASLSSAKDGKALKSVPAKLKKHETVVALTDMVKTLTEQYRRTRVMLEQAMEDGTAFTFAELSALSAHPVVYPMLKNLVLVSGDAAGFLAPDGLADDTGSVRKLCENAEVKIAHPFHLYSKGCWRNYQKYLFENKIAQPFRQVFRELYIKTAEEMGTFHSLRYAGNQIQPAKTVGALKSRRWVADIEDGLQKVYYKENIVAEIYALADWFSPADIEAPTLEWVCFSDRKTGEEIKIADIPDIVFSEVMRDVDLAVSVAHAGGVDPETSHSTMEMRAAILSFVLPMFRIANVKIEGNHAIIDGKLAEYSVHLGSGVVHRIGGAMIPVLPVHSQHRGKIFLPFVDDDPKTAEIISKVLLFAEDGKIKDPMILSNITR